VALTSNNISLNYPVTPPTSMPGAPVFLSPTYPEADAPGSERIKPRKRARCAAFEAHHRGI
jgi:hypothetical protein